MAARVRFPAAAGRLRRTSNRLLQVASTLPEPTGKPEPSRRRIPHVLAVISR